MPCLRSLAVVQFHLTSVTIIFLTFSAVSKIDKLEYSHSQFILIYFRFYLLIKNIFIVFFRGIFFVFFSFLTFRIGYAAAFETD